MYKCYLGLARATGGNRRNKEAVDYMNQAIKDIGSSVYPKQKKSLEEAKIKYLSFMKKSGRSKYRGSRQGRNSQGQRGGPSNHSMFAESRRNRSNQSQKPNDRRRGRLKTNEDGWNRV